MKKNKKAFTLVELMIVIVIIGILAAIIIPTVTGAIQKAKKARDTANANAVNVQLALMQIDNLASGNVINTSDIQSVIDELAAVGITTETIDGNTYLATEVSGTAIFFNPETMQAELVDGSGMYYSNNEQNVGGGCTECLRG